MSNASDAAAALRRVPERETAFVLIWRSAQELFLPVARRVAQQLVLQAQLRLALNAKQMCTTFCCDTCLL